MPEQTIPVRVTIARMVTWRRLPKNEEAVAVVQQVWCSLPPLGEEVRE